MCRLDSSVNLYVNTGAVGYILLVDRTYYYTECVQLHVMLDNISIIYCHNRLSRYSILYACAMLSVG